MTIRKITGAEGGFCIVPNDTLNDTLSWAAKGLLAYLCSKPDDWSVSVQQLVNHSKESAKPTGRDGTYSLLNELIEAGYVRRIESRVNGRYVGNEYLVSPTPFPPETYTAKPLPTEPTLQKKEINKERLEQNNNSLFAEFDQEEEKPKPLPKPKTKAAEYTEDYEKFWKAYPSTKGMSKANGFKEWKKLSEAHREEAMASLGPYAMHLRETPWKSPKYVQGYLSGRMFESFTTPQEQKAKANTKTVRKGDPDFEKVYGYMMKKRETKMKWMGKDEITYNAVFHDQIMRSV